MSTPALIRVLHVDDEESQCEFAKMFLEQDGVIQVTSATSVKEALQLLEKESYDCIVSDYQMPEMTGIQLAEKIKSHISIPFILYTGRGSEEVAEAAFKVGIDDYIRKEVEPAHFQVLANRIRQIVELARGEKSLKANEEKFKRFFMNQPVLCYIISKEGNIVEVNETVLETLGYTTEDLIGKPVITTIYSPSSRRKAEQLFRRWLETGELRNEELNIVTKTGEERTVLLNVDAVRDESGGVVQNISVQVDITQRRQMEEELKMRAYLLDAATDSIFLRDFDGNFIYVNEAAYRTRGYSRDELMKMNVSDLVSSEDVDLIKRLNKEVMEKGVATWEPIHIRKDKSLMPVEVNTRIIELDGRKAFLGVVRDITRRKEMEEHLRESEERYRTLVENSPNAISVLIGDTIVYANQKRADLAGKDDPSELVGTSALSQVAEGDREPIIKIREARERGEGSPLPFEYRMLRADGNVRDILDYHSEITFQGKNAVQHVLHDVTDEKRYEKRLEALHRHASELHLAGNLQQICELTLDAMEKALNFKDASFLFVEKGILIEKGVRGTPILDIPLPLDGKGITVKAANTRQTVLVNDLRGDHDFVMGPIDSLSELATPVLIDGETVAVLNVESLDLNAFTGEDQMLLETLAQHVASALSRLRGVEKLRFSEEKYRSFMDKLRDAVFVLDNKTYLYVNQAAADLLGYESPGEIIDLPSYSVVAPEERKMVKQRTAARARGEDVPNRYELTLLRRDSGRVLTEANVARIMFDGKPASLAIHRDITERKKMENELRGYMESIENRLEEKTKEMIEAEVMSAAGKVAIMLGHDLWGPIQAIRGNLYLLRKSPEKAEERLKAIDDATDRMGVMVEELRTKIRDTLVAVQAVDLAALAWLCLKETPVPKGVKTQLVVGAGLDSLMLDPLKMRRVLDNLVRNAMEAMPEGGNLAISAERMGSEAVIKVSDTGVGIPEEAMRRLFKPFNTTKSGGLGLGLAYCKMAVEAHGGTITAESKVGEGTTFTVTLPLHPMAQPKNP